MEEILLMKGNEALAEGAIRAGADGYFGYPITPQSEVMEYLASQNLEERTGMITLQTESELAAINMVYGGAGCGKRVMISSSSPGISLMQEGISYLAGAELPCLIVNVTRGGPGLGTIQGAQSDYFQAVKGGGHGDYKLIVLAPSSVQEMADFVSLAFDLAFNYRNPALILTDGIIGQMMEKVKLPRQQKRRTKSPDWATTGKTSARKQNIITSVELDPAVQEAFNHKLVAKYQKMKDKEVRYEQIQCEDAEYLLIAYGTSTRVCKKAVELGRKKGIKVGLLRPITLFPFPEKELERLADQVYGMMTIEMSTGQMIEDVKLATQRKVPVYHYGRMGGLIPSPDEVIQKLTNNFLEG